MIIYRPHRGTLQESLADQKEYKSLTELYFDINFTKIQYYAYDKRCNQTLFMVFKHDFPLGYICEEANFYERKANEDDEYTMAKNRRDN